MNKQLLRFTLFLLIYLILPLSATAQVVDIPDPGLREAIEEALGKSPGEPITADNMLTVRSIERWGWGSGPDISDLTGVEFASNLEVLTIAHRSVSDLSPLAGLTRLKSLYLGHNVISDLSPLAGLTSLRTLLFYGNKVSDISPLVGLTNLEFLNIAANSISDLSLLAGLTELEYLKIDNNSISDLSPLAGLTKLETLYLLNNSITDLSPLVANTGLGAGDTIFLFGNPLSDTSINTHIPTLRHRGVTAHRTILFLPTINPVSVGDTFTLDLIIEDVVDLAGWQLDIEFNSAVLSAISVSEGNFLSKEGGQTFFKAGDINSDAGTITAASAAFLGIRDISGTGVLLSVTFETKAAGEGQIKLHNLELGSVDRDDIPYEIAAYPFNFKPRYDVNRDELLNILDLILVGQNLSQANPQTDVDGDGTVSIFDLIAVSQHLGESITPLAPGTGMWWHLSVLDSTTIQSWIDMAYAADDGSETFRQGIANLKQLLLTVGNAEPRSLPNKTALLANYPNPFNPETWIPYHLSNATDVTLTIYDTKGVLVRQLDLGYQQAGYYTNRTRAAYWDGRNHLGEAVGSGVYFYQLRAGDYSTIRKMVILK